MTFKKVLNKALPVLATIAAVLTFSVASAHTGAPSDAALLVCEAKQKSQACQYEGAHSDLYIGTCQYMPDQLLCVRNQPIQKKVESEKTETEEKHESHKK